MKTIFENEVSVVQFAFWYVFAINEFQGQSGMKNIK